MVEHYLTDRLEAAPGVGGGPLVDLHPEVSRGGRGTDGILAVSWKLPPGEGGHFGTILLRPRDQRAGDPQAWSVVAARTSGLDLSHLRVVDGVLTGPIGSDSSDLLAVDVLDGARRPVPGSLDPDGYGAGATWGTSGTSDGGTLTIGVPVGDVAFVRPVLVDGSFRGIGEFGVAGGSANDLGTTTTTTAGDSTTTSAAATGDPAPPWAAAPLPASQAAATVEAWGSAGSPGDACPAVAPADLGEGAGATARATTRGQPGGSKGQIEKPARWSWWSGRSRHRQGQPEGPLHQYRGGVVCH